MTMEFQEFLTFDNAEMIAPIGLSFGMHSRGADMFLLQIIGDKDSPIRFNGRMIAFDDESVCRGAVERLEPLLPKGVRIEQKYDFLCDIYRAIRLVTKERCDRDAVVLNCINTLLDFVATGPFDLPDEYKILVSLVDRLTFREEFGEFIQSKSLIQNGLLWCAGMTVVDLTMVRTLTEFESLLSNLSAAPHK